ncbi:MAG: hypothetical protein KGZ55_07500 [Sphingomonadaceae bacterium]|nr:hypothetical protein [Sphingomonadaceae bacterium]
MPISSEMDEIQMPHTIMRQSGESLFSAWLRGMDTVPPGYCGPIVIR